MMDLLVTIPAFIVAISILVVVHEFGHYWVAKSLGVKVLRFSVGFGKPLWMRRAGRDDTEWVIAAVPLGGYVKMLDENEGEVPKRELARAFNRQPIWKRALIVLAGPASNLLFALLVYSVVNMAGVEGLRPEVGKVAEGTLGQVAGFQAGDFLLQVDGRPVQSWDQQRMYLYERALDRADVRFTVRAADGQTRERVMSFATLSPADVGAGLLEREMGLVPAMPVLRPEIGEVEKASPAEQAGLKAGDVITAVDGKATPAWVDVVAAVSAKPAAAIHLEVSRGGQTHQLALTTQRVERGDKVIGRMGAGVHVPELPAEYRVMIHYSPWAALSESAETTWRMSTLTLKMLGKMLMLEVSTKTISGPLTIAQYAGTSAKIGLDRFVLFLAVISVSLGVLNLLPIPVLDGGHLLMYVFEAAVGRPLSERSLHWAQQIGIALLVALMTLALYNDLMRILSH